MQCFYLRIGFKGVMQFHTHACSQSLTSLRRIPQSSSSQLLINTSSADQPWCRQPLQGKGLWFGQQAVVPAGKSRGVDVHLQGSLARPRRGRQPMIAVEERAITSEGEEGFYSSKYSTILILSCKCYGNELFSPLLAIFSPTINGLTNLC